MAVTLTELQQNLQSRYSPDEIVELLDITSEELVDMFTERIDEKWDYLLKELDMEEGDGDDEAADD